MTDRLQDGPILVHRSDILDGLRALYFTQLKFDRLLKEDNYACGYRAGFEDALLSVMQMVGVSNEFETVKQRLNSSVSDKLPIYNTNGR